MEKTIAKNMLIAEVCKTIPCTIKENQEETFLVPANISENEGLLPSFLIDPIVTMIAHEEISAITAAQIIANKLNDSCDKELIMHVNQMIKNFNPKNVFGRLFWATKENMNEMYQKDALIYFPPELKCHNAIGVKFQYSIDEQEDYTKSILITLGIAEAIGLNVTQLYDLAKNNVSLKNFEFNNMNVILKNMILSNPDIFAAIEDEEKEILSEPSAFCVMSEFKKSGAFCVLSDVGKFYLKKLARNNANRKVIIIPSSTEEVLLLNEDFNDTNTNDLKEIIDSVNASDAITPQEILYNAPLIYDLVTDQITCYKSL